MRHLVAVGVVFLGAAAPLGAQEERRPALTPEEAAAIQIKSGPTTEGDWIVGRLARKKAGEAPGRVVHSAKSWLCHHTSDRTTHFLPWGSDDIARSSKISPLRASAIILSQLKEAWNGRFAHKPAARAACAERRDDTDTCL